MGSQWEYAEYEPSNIHIYEKEFHDYVVYYVVQENLQILSDSRRPSSTGNAKKKKRKINGEQCFASCCAKCFKRIF